jgi:hypothetical protein
MPIPTGVGKRTCPVTAVISTGRCNTCSESICSGQSKLKASASVESRVMPPWLV